MPDSDDPSVVHTVAVTAEDAVAAYESTRQPGADVVLRLTPPFHGRMRARVHVPTGDYPDDPAPVHVPPTALVDESAVPPYPTADDTAADLRGDPDADYSVDAHYDRHRDALDDWRDAVRDAIRDHATLDLGGEEQRVEVVVLG